MDSFSLYFPIFMKQVTIFFIRLQKNNTKKHLPNKNPVTFFSLKRFLLS